jgi:hypothetical protein
MSLIVALMKRSPVCLSLVVVLLGVGQANGNMRGPVVITEAANCCCTDYVEIQNVSASTVDTTGWVVAVNDANDENLAHTTLWELPDLIDPNELLYRDDVGDDPEHWGDGIYWPTTGPGWVMMLDDLGEIADFVVWGYSEAEIASIDLDIGGFTGITVGDAWSGSSAPAHGAPVNSLQRFGNADHDDASDWAWIEPQSVDTELDQGFQNQGLTTPFVPEPSTILLSSTAALALAGYNRRRARRA